MQWCMDEDEEEEPRKQNHSAAKKVQHKKTHNWICIQIHKKGKYDERENKLNNGKIVKIPD